MPVTRETVDLSRLLALVHTDPCDLGARAVYADALLEAGDPRGELIALQLERGRANGRRSRRELELLAHHRGDWLGPIASVIDDLRSSFDHGFLRAVALRGDRPAMTADLLDHVEWRTVEHLDAASIEPAPALHHEAAELLARLPRLSALVAGSHGLRAIGARLRSHQLQRLSLTPRTSGLRGVFALLDAGTLPQLRWLRLWSGGVAEDDVIQLGARLGTAVELELIAGPHHPERLARLIDRLAPKLRAVAVQSAWGRARATLADGRIAIELRELEPAGSPAFRAILDRLGAGRVVVRLRDALRATASALVAAGIPIEVV